MSCTINVEADDDNKENHPEKTSVEEVNKENIPPLVINSIWTRQCFEKLQHTTSTKGIYRPRPNDMQNTMKHLTITELVTFPYWLFGSIPSSRPPLKIELQ